MAGERSAEASGFLHARRHSLHRRRCSVAFTGAAHVRSLNSLVDSRLPATMSGSEEAKCLPRRPMVDAFAARFAIALPAHRRTAWCAIATAVAGLDRKSVV